MISLDSSWAKLARGVHHGQALTDELRSGLDPDLYPVDIKVDLKRGSDIFAEVSQVPIVGWEALAMIGDAVHDFSSSLDHLAWVLVARANGGRVPRKRVDDVGFPWSKRAATFPENRKRMLPGVPKDQWTIIRHYQPYQTNEGAKALRLLRRLSITDKHRHFNLTMLNIAPAEGGRLKLDTPGYTIWRFNMSLLGSQVLRVGTPVLSAQVIPLLEVPASQRNVKVEGNLGAFPAFKPKAPWIVTSVISIAETVLEILTRFSRVLG